MELFGKVINKSFTDDGKLTLTISVEDYVSKEKASSIIDEKIMKLKITQVKDKRTLAQNRLLWELIEQLSEYINDEPINVYSMALEQANAKYEYLQCYPSVVKELQKSFRAVKVMNYVEQDGVIYAIVKCFIGSSEFDKEEIDKLLSTLYKFGADIGMKFRYAEGY